VKSLGDVSQLRGCILTVVRVNKQGKFMNSKPCAACVKFLEKCIKKYGLLKVLYSSNEGGPECAHDIRDGDGHTCKDSCA
jgi:competence protein ComGC